MAEKDDLRKICNCPRCPTYNDCCRKGNELIFCQEKRSSCKIEKYGCFCPSCPVEKIRGFSGVYFCVSGKASR